MANEKDKKATLEGRELGALLSPYWSNGYKQDTHLIKRATINGYVIEAECKMAEYFISPTAEGRFHLSIFNATTFLCQVGITHALALNDYTEKTVEVLMTDFSIQLTSVIGDPEHIPVRMNLIGRTMSGLSKGPEERRRTPRSFYRWRFAIDGDKWWGVIGLCFPFG
jgi:hypothetical protein